MGEARGAAAGAPAGRERVKEAYAPLREVRSPNPQSNSFRPRGLPCLGGGDRGPGLSGTLERRAGRRNQKKTSFVRAIKSSAKINRVRCNGRAETRSATVP